MTNNDTKRNCSFRINWCKFKNNLMHRDFLSNGTIFIQICQDISPTPHRKSSLSCCQWFQICSLGSFSIVYGLVDQILIWFINMWLLFQTIIVLHLWTYYSNPEKTVHSTYAKIYYFYHLTHPGSLIIMFWTLWDPLTLRTQLLVTE